MKYLKMLSIAAIAAMAFSAFAGAGTASATEACTVNISPCPDMYGPGTTIEANSTNATLTSSLGNVVCTSSSISGSINSTGGPKLSVEGQISSLSFSDCSLATPFGGAKHNCTVTAIHLPYKAVLARTTQPNGTLTVSSGGFGEPGAKVDCGASILRCQFTSPSIVLDVNGGEAPTVVASAEGLNRTVYEGGLCPSTSTWDATYTITAPHALYVVN